MIILHRNALFKVKILKKIKNKKLEEKIITKMRTHLIHLSFTKKKLSFCCNEVEG
jgi:hypothetical protein